MGEQTETNEEADARQWEERYRGQDRLFSGEPNGTLVAEVSGMSPGSALDVGCGEGADALWLAGRGWRTTGIDVSETALRRADESDPNRGVTWTRTNVLATPPVGRYDLVSVHYFPLRHPRDEAAVRGLLDAVAPGGTLLFVGHASADLVKHTDIDPGDYYQPDDVAGLLGDGWTVLVNETRPRTRPGPPGTHHTRDAVLRVVRAR
ncbi:class I SAM-dependent methyltransferase [Glycomyces buryatensis]|uniref:Class I SAM-dependent methyltransferase n=1 Tax=Glycomyces buryatensis TaxID=2570927 RepID=A0A4S8QHQ0_9ACTN|nr:class I SAM-dependent methyltransferase [Glycomyces buryatensis]THV40214.1 class I SAM-dependent methyltransferase [Glycomyces buryatensis]